MKRLTLMMTGIGLLAAACAGGGPVVIGPAPSGSGPTPSPTAARTASPSPSGTPSPSGRKVTFELWFEREGALFLTSRTEPFTPAVGGLSLDALALGPSAAELASGVRTELPPNASLAITALAGGVATVDSGSTTGLQGTSKTDRIRRAQIVYTLTQYSTITRVRFVSSGAPADSTLYRRTSFDDLLPAILVETPVIGQRISNPVTISGTANVFEATVSIRILDENGKTVANTFTTATCGTGCRGDYSASVPYSVDHQQDGTVEVYESSAQDGSAINVQAIPVTLTP